MPQKYNSGKNAVQVYYVILETLLKIIALYCLLPHVKQLRFCKPYH